MPTPQIDDEHASGTERPESDRSWRQKLADALRGIRRAVATNKSFAVHAVFTVAVVAVAAGMGMTIERWSLLLLSVAVVWSAEAFNTALEFLARSVTSSYDENIRDALDIASGAVLLAAIGAASVGAVVFLTRLLELLAD